MKYLTEIQNSTEKSLFISLLYLTSLHTDIKSFSIAKKEVKNFKILIISLPLKNSLQFDLKEKRSQINSQF